MKKIILIIIASFLMPGICFSQFTDNGDGTITDDKTGLTWMKSTADTDSDGDVDVDDKLSWQDALVFCNTLELAGKSDWRLPNVKELSSIVDRAKIEPMIDTSYFAETMLSSSYATSTSRTALTDHAWGVSFDRGTVGSSSKTDYHFFVRPVRGGSE